MENQANILRYILPAIYLVTGIPFNQIKLIKDIIIVINKVKAENSLLTKNILYRPLIPVRADKVNKEAQDNIA